MAVSGPDLGLLLNAVRGHGSGRATVIVGNPHDAADAERMLALAHAALGHIDHVITPERSDAVATITRLPTRGPIRRPESVRGNAVAA